MSTCTHSLCKEHNSWICAPTGLPRCIDVSTALNIILQLETSCLAWADDGEREPSAQTALRCMRSRSIAHQIVAFICNALEWRIHFDVEIQADERLKQPMLAAAAADGSQLSPDASQHFISFIIRMLSCLSNIEHQCTCVCKVDSFVSRRAALAQAALCVQTAAELCGIEVQCPAYTWQWIETALKTSQHDGVPAVNTSHLGDTIAWLMHPGGGASTLPRVFVDIVRDTLLTSLFHPKDYCEFELSFNNISQHSNTKITHNSPKEPAGKRDTDGADDTRTLSGHKRKLNDSVADIRTETATKFNATDRIVPIQHANDVRDDSDVLRRGMVPGTPRRSPIRQVDIADDRVMSYRAVPLGTETRDNMEIHAAIHDITRNQVSQNISGVVHSEGAAGGGVCHPSGALLFPQDRRIASASSEGRAGVPLEGKDKMASEGRAEVRLGGRAEVTSEGRAEVPLEGRAEVTSEGRAEVTSEGRAPGSRTCFGLLEGRTEVTSVEKLQGIRISRGPAIDDSQSPPRRIGHVSTQGHHRILLPPENPTAFAIARARLAKLTTQQLVNLLMLNEMKRSGGSKDELIERCAEAVVNGCIPRCPRCCQGYLRMEHLRSAHMEGGVVYRCPGFFDELTHQRMPCSFQADKVERHAWKWHT